MAVKHLKISHDTFWLMFFFFKRPSRVANDPCI